MSDSNGHIQGERSCVGAQNADGGLVAECVAAGRQAREWACARQSGSRSGRVVEVVVWSAMKDCGGRKSETRQAGVDGSGGPLKEGGRRERCYARCDTIRYAGAGAGAGAEFRCRCAPAGNRQDDSRTTNAM